jgi:endonuclease/exonuclease/phosphatase family metal-dependent hydrolase
MLTLYTNPIKFGLLAVNNMQPGQYITYTDPSKAVQGVKAIPRYEALIVGPVKQHDDDTVSLQLQKRYSNLNQEVETVELKTDAKGILDTVDLLTPTLKIETYNAHNLSDIEATVIRYGKEQTTRPKSTDDQEAFSVMVNGGIEGSNNDDEGKTTTSIKAFAESAKNNLNPPDLLALQEVNVRSHPSADQISEEAKKAIFGNPSAGKQYYVRYDAHNPLNNPFTQLSKDSPYKKNIKPFSEKPSKSLLERLNEGFWKSRYKIVSFSTNSERGFGQAILYDPNKLALVRTRESYHQDFRRAFVGCLFQVKPSAEAYAKFQNPDELFWFFTLHLKSKLQETESGKIRLKEARRIREILNELFEKDPKARVVIAGDYNDAIGSPALNVIMNGDAETPANQRLFNIPKKNNQPTYAYEKYSSTRANYLSNTQYSDVDHILVSQAIYDKQVELNESYTFGSFVGKNNTDGYPSDHLPTYFHYIPQTIYPEYVAQAEF